MDSDLRALLCRLIAAVPDEESVAQGLDEIINYVYLCWRTKTAGVRATVLRFSAIFQTPAIVTAFKSRALPALCSGDESTDSMSLYGVHLLFASCVLNAEELAAEIASIGMRFRPSSLMDFPSAPAAAATSLVQFLQAYYQIDCNEGSVVKEAVCPPQLRAIVTAALDGVQASSLATITSAVIARVTSAQSDFVSDSVDLTTHCLDTWKHFIISAFQSLPCTRDAILTACLHALSRDSGHANIVVPPTLLGSLFLVLCHTVPPSAFVSMEHRVAAWISCATLDMNYRVVDALIAVSRCSSIIRASLLDWIRRNLLLIEHEAGVAEAGFALPNLFPIALHGLVRLLPRCGDDTSSETHALGLLTAVLASTSHATIANAARVDLLSDWLATDPLLFPDELTVSLNTMAELLSSELGVLTSLLPPDVTDSTVVDGEQRFRSRLGTILRSQDLSDNTVPSHDLTLVLRTCIALLAAVVAQKPDSEVVSAAMPVLSGVLLPLTRCLVHGGAIASLLELAPRALTGVKDVLTGVRVPHLVSLYNVLIAVFVHREPVVRFLIDPALAIPNQPAQPFYVSVSDAREPTAAEPQDEPKLSVQIVTALYLADLAATLAALIAPTESTASARNVQSEDMLWLNLPLPTSPALHPDVSVTIALLQALQGWSGDESLPVGRLALLNLVLSLLPVLRHTTTHILYAIDAPAARECVGLIWNLLVRTVPLAIRCRYSHTSVTTPCTITSHSGDVTGQCVVITNFEGFFSQLRKDVCVALDYAMLIGMPDEGVIPLMAACLLGVRAVLGTCSLLSGSALYVLTDEAPLPTATILPPDAPVGSPLRVLVPPKRSSQVGDIVSQAVACPIFVLVSGAQRTPELWQLLSSRYFVGCVDLMIAAIQKDDVFGNVGVEWVGDRVPVVSLTACWLLAQLKRAFVLGLRATTATCFASTAGWLLPMAIARDTDQLPTLLPLLHTNLGLFGTSTFVFYRPEVLVDWISQTSAFILGSYGIGKMQVLNELVKLAMRQPDLQARCAVASQIVRTALIVPDLPADAVGLQPRYPWRLMVAQSEACAALAGRSATMEYENVLRNLISRRTPGQKMSLKQELLHPKWFEVPSFQILIDIALTAARDFVDITLALAHRVRKDHVGVHEGTASRLSKFLHRFVNWCTFVIRVCCGIALHAVNGIRAATEAVDLEACRQMCGVLCTQSGCMLLATSVAECLTNVNKLKSPYTPKIVSLVFALRTFCSLTTFIDPIVPLLQALQWNEEAEQVTALTTAIQAASTQHGIVAEPVPSADDAKQSEERPSKPRTKRYGRAPTTDHSWMTRKRRSRNAVVDAWLAEDNEAARGEVDDYADLDDFIVPPGAEID